MRLYAVLSNQTKLSHVLIAIHYPWVLQSYAANKDLRRLMRADNVRDLGEYQPRGLLLDSGAFSVWNSGDTVDRASLVSWAKEMRDEFGEAETRLFNLDVIPGERGSNPTERERLHAAEASAENAQAIRAEGLPVIEVFHGRELIRFLEGILERRQPGEWIAIGGMGGMNMADKDRLCATAFTTIKEFCGGWDKLVSVHGLGMSGDSPLATRYPWFSCDASTWFTAINYNNHVGRGGKYVARNLDTAPRTTDDMAQLFLRRRLARWGRWEQSLTELWRGRGVRFAP